MAVAAYASLVSLSDVLDNIQHSARRHRLHLDTEQIHSLQQNVQFLQHFLELHDSQRISPEMEDLARQLAVVATKQTISLTSTCFCACGFYALPSSDKNTMVGIDDLLLQVVDELTRDESNLQILPIVGMGGIASLLHTKLRYLYIDGYERIEEDRKLIVPGTISIVWNLQILDLNHLDTTTLSEVWEMRKLRHLSVYKGRLPDPVEGQDSTILEDLSTLGIGEFCCSEEIVKRIPNLKELRVRQRLSGDYSLVKLNKLESLRLIGNNSRLEDIGFPTSLKKLILSGSKIPWKKITIIGSSLPNLEVLKLDSAFVGPEWNPIEGEFLRLKVLTIDSIDLEQWGAEDIHFPNLHGLYLTFMRNLKEISLSIGDINPLKSIHLEFCSRSANNSTVEILKDQKEKGNESLQVYVDKIQVSVASL
ncbi:hypothetical protein Sango_1623200 [Sesamum angolense]|uniref:Disease resistance R13L4/SHOC-2-like LRR domain-containing protein n=1 Tax=Sesamum angolense TaxID=2727404 RepID=A0AAE1WJX0_9LAMI|nr:hypothetical protein Sango_1623200 [Sesamum angolense]